ncbi:MAG: 4-hydroxy-3-methylbut-2-enyl diphosphate reductase [Candidatus Binatia bacterium]|nr:4-hydroxy-3-methylbut-2-enyl diphosphate reductase [Candidatus Binatia bacterium]
MNTTLQKIILAQPRGFCAGVEMAIESVERALKKYGPPLYIYHEIVHNRTVVGELAGRGVKFVQSVAEVPKGARLIYSAHGVSPAVRKQAAKKQLSVTIDATCPLVEKVHREVRRFADQGYWIILIGHRTHDEIVGTSREAQDRIQVVATVEEATKVIVPDPERVAVLTQTTLSVDDTKEIMDALRERFPKIITPAKEDICYATQNRQDAVKELAREADLIVVIGSKNSENSNQLCRVARSMEIPVYLINGHRDIDPSWLVGIKRIGVTSGASAPEQLVQETARRLAQEGAEVTHVGFREEDIHFALPPEVTNPT